jgi:hypothetical protein
VDTDRRKAIGGGCVCGVLGCLSGAVLGGCAVAAMRPAHATGNAVADAMPDLSGLGTFVALIVVGGLAGAVIGAIAGARFFGGPP